MDEEEEEEEESSRNITALIFHPRALARAVSRLFLILHRGRECFTLRPRPLTPVWLSRLPLPPFPLSVLFVYTKAAVSRLVTNLRY